MAYTQNHLFMVILLQTWYGDRSPFGLRLSIHILISLLISPDSDGFVILLYLAIHTACNAVHTNCEQVRHLENCQ